MEVGFLALLLSASSGKFRPEQVLTRSIAGSFTYTYTYLFTPLSHTCVPHPRIISNHVLRYSCRDSGCTGRVCADDKWVRPSLPFNLRRDVDRFPRAEKPKYDRSNVCVKCKENTGNIVIRHVVYCKLSSLFASERIHH